jgi:hypothetical protein
MLSATQFMVSLAMAAAAAVSAPAKAAPDCITTDINPIPTLCRGQAATLGVTVANACSESKRVALTFDLDKETIREKGEMVMEPLESIQKQVLLPLPATIASGRHTVTIHVKDAAGNVSSTDVDVVVDRCSNL